MIDDDILQFFGVMMTLLVTGLGGYLGITVIGALQRRLGKVEHHGLDPGEVQALRAQLEETDDLRQRIAELEERVDFTERMLAQQQETPRIAGERQ